MTTEMREALERCPFCGGEAKIGYIRDGRRVACRNMKCIALGPSEFHGRDDQPSADVRAAKAWNRRAALAQAVVDATPAAEPAANPTRAEIAQVAAEPAASERDGAEFETWWAMADEPLSIRLITHDEARIAFQAGASCARSLSAPAGEGWKLVPVEPTREMQEAVSNWAVGGPYLGEADAEDIWGAMIEAAPTPPEGNMQIMHNAPSSTGVGDTINSDAVKDAMEDGGGHWRSCTGCHELNEGAPTGRYSAALECHVGMGCTECGGIGAIWDRADYDAMARDIMAGPISEVDDLWFVDSSLPIMAISGDGDGDGASILKLHFRHTVTNADRDEVIAALNARIPVPTSPAPDKTVSVEAAKDAQEDLEAIRLILDPYCDHDDESAVELAERAYTLISDAEEILHPGNDGDRCVTDLAKAAVARIKELEAAPESSLQKVQGSPAVTAPVSGEPVAWRALAAPIIRMAILDAPTDGSFRERAENREFIVRKALDELQALHPSPTFKEGAE